MARSKSLPTDSVLRQTLRPATSCGYTRVNSLESSRNRHSFTAVGDKVSRMRQPPLRILSVSAEVAPYSKTGGLSDVASALPKALHQPNDETYPIQVTTLTPLYRCVREVLHKRKGSTRHRRCSGKRGPQGHSILSERFISWCSLARPNYSLYTAPLYDRDGIYDDPEAKRQHGDNPIRFMFLCHAAMQLEQHLPEGVPDILHTRMTGKLLCSHS